PRDVVKAGDVVKVKVMDVDLKRQRIALSMRLDDVPGEKSAAMSRDRRPRDGGRRDSTRSTNRPPATPAAGGTLADAFARARKS
ncbi:MAG TPA: S1 RNA-binding domain-containing protein, partial [Rhodanobacteraceae bacterium]|nr:S1 RNA-binding domain-containing protein [Rhodanobacteraceae bacterium]